MNTEKELETKNSPKSTKNNHMAFFTVGCTLLIVIMAVCLIVNTVGSKHSEQSEQSEQSGAIEAFDVEETTEEAIVEDIGAVNDILDNISVNVEASEDTSGISSMEGFSGNELKPSSVTDSIEASEGIVNADGNTSGNPEVHMDAYREEVKQDPIQLIEYDMRQIRLADADVIADYFGKSKTFSPDNIADKVAAALISFVSVSNIDDVTDEVLVHICTLDYEKMKHASETARFEAAMSGIDDIDKEAQKNVARGVIEGEFDVHFNIPVTVKNNQVEITEEFKQAITGNWYKGVNTTLRSVECVHTEQNYSDAYDSAEAEGKLN